MSTPTSRIAALAGALLLAACQSAPSDDGASDAAPASPVEQVRAWVEGVKDERPRIFCAIGEGTALAENCRIETVDDAPGKQIILYRPDGGFRRVRVNGEGALSAADGAIEIRIAQRGQYMGVLFGNERYALPMAILKPGTAR